MIHRAVFLVLICSLSGWSEEAKTIHVRTLALQKGEMPELYLRGPEAHVALQWSHRQPGKPIEVLATHPLLVYRRVINDEGETAFVVASKVKSPHNAKRLLLIGWSRDNETRCVGIRDNIHSAGYDDWLLINAASKSVAFTVGEERKPAIVKPGQSVNYRVAVARGKGAAVLAQLPVKGGGAKTFYSTFWPIHPEKRVVVIFADDGRKISVKRISDKLPEKDS